VIECYDKNHSKPNVIAITDANDPYQTSFTAQTYYGH